MEDVRFSQWWLWRIPSSGMLRHVALVRIDVSEKRSASIIRVTRIGELGIMLAATSNQWTLMMEALSSSETSVLTRAKQHNIPEDGILQITFVYVNLISGFIFLTNCTIFDKLVLGQSFFWMLSNPDALSRHLLIYVCCCWNAISSNNNLISSKNPSSCLENKKITQKFEVFKAEKT
jgi:hypothetical protein